MRPDAEQLLGGCELNGDSKGCTVLRDIEVLTTQSGDTLLNTQKFC